MNSFKALLNSRTKYLQWTVLLISLTLICGAFSFTEHDDFELAKQEILLRKIGHEVLLQAGDSTSRVLPVNKITENEYQIRFEKEFTFQPDSLVKTISRSLAKDNLTDDYVVNVLNCEQQEVIFGYAILKNKKENIVPCRGRAQPKSCYLIDIKFQNTGFTTSQKGYLMGGIPLLAIIGLVISRSVKPRKQPIETTVETGIIKIANTIFDSNKRQLISGTMTSELTMKENKLLLILAGNLNVVIERSRLQKEIWEDEGVIVGRSLDMFISKLRKKLEIDSTIALTNIHGKGYKLVIL